MKKKIFLGLGIALISVIAFAAMGHIKGKVSGEAVVKMTYVDYDNPDAAAGEVTTAVGGYNKISGGNVAMAMSSWGVNKIIYLQVDLSGITADRNFKKVTLTAECSGATDSKRTTGWGVGWNETPWSADMTYNTADKSIMLCGDVAWTSTKAAGTFETLSWDISDAFVSGNKVATILVYETAAAGGNFRNPVVTVEEEPLLFNTEAATEVPVTMATYLQAEGNTAPAGCQDIAYYDSTATVWKADQSKFGATFSNMLSTYGGTQVTLAKFDITEYEIPFDYEIESVSLALYAKCTVSGKNSNIHGVAIPNTGIDLTTATWNNTNTAEVLGEMTDLGTIGNGNSSGVTMSKDITEYFNTVNGKVFLFGFYTETGRNQDVSDIKLVVKVKPIIHETNLAYFINEAIKDKAAGEDAVLDLDPSIAYTFDTPVDAGLVNLTINGGGKTIALADSVQIATQASLTINDINFDCAANTKLAPIAMSATPDSSLIGANIQTEGTNLRGSAFYDLGTITLNNCNFSEVKTPLVSANKMGWNLYGLTIQNCIVQFDVASGIDSYINWYGNSSNEGSIKNIVIKNSTMYNIVESNDNYFLRYQNSSNSQPQKAWAEPQFDGKCSWTMTNNTIVNLPSNKNFANNYPNKNPICEFTWKGNIFYNTSLLQKAIQGNVANFTAADNSIWGVTKAVDATDASKFATVDSTLVFTVPTAALDLTSLDLSANFTPGSETYAAEEGFGDPRWKGTPANVFYSQDYEKVGVAVDWKTAASGRYDPMIATEGGNHYLCANPNNCNNNGTTMSTTNTDPYVAGNTDFTMSVDVRLGSSSDQTATEFDIFDAAKVVKLLSIRETGKNTTKWILNENVADTLDLAGTENGAYVEGRPWYNFTITMYSGVLFVSVKNTETGEVIVDKKVFDHQSAEGGVGGMQFITSRYNAAFAIDNVVVRKTKSTDLPEGLVPTQYTINYIYGGNPIKEARVASTFVGYEVKASDADMTAIYDKTDDVINMKYLYDSGAQTITAAEDASQNVINLVFRQANRVQYKLTGTWGATEKTINLIKKDSPLSWEGEKVLSYYPEFILDGDSLGYCSDGQQVSKQYTYEEVLPAENYVHKLPYSGGYTVLNQTTPGTIKNVLFYSEAEELEGFTKSEQVNQGIRCSAGYCAYNLEDQTLMTLEPGTYYIATQFWGGTADSQWEIGKIQIGEVALSVSTTGSIGQVTKTVTITEATPVIVKAIDQTTDYKNSGYDWFLIQKLNAPEITTSKASILCGDSVDVANYVTSTSTNAITYTSSDENIAKVVDGKLIGVAQGAATITVNQAEGNGFTAGTATFEVSVNGLATLPEIAANAYYSWQSPEGEVQEVGGKAVAVGDETRVNYSQAPAFMQFYTICLCGKKDLSDGKYITVTLDQALAENDTIVVYAFKNKIADNSKKSGVKFFWGAEGTSSVMACGDDFPDLFAGGEPVAVKYAVPAAAAGQNVFRMSRSETGTNLFIAQLYIVPSQVPTGINEVNNSIFSGETMYNIRGQKVTKANKGEIILVKGKKYIVK